MSLWPPIRPDPNGRLRRKTQSQEVLACHLEKFELRITSSTFVNTAQAQANIKRSLTKVQQQHTDSTEATAKASIKLRQLSTRALPIKPALHMHS